MASARKKEWFDNEAFWQDLYPFFFPESRFAAAVTEVEQAIALARPSGKAALDLCCGPGRCSLALAQTGFSVTGVDRTPYLLSKARARARAALARIEWVRSDMRDFVRPQAFDLALNMFSSFGYFDDKREDAKVLSNVLTSLKPGGAFAIDVMGKERLAKILLPTSSDELPDGTRIVEHHEIIDDWTRIRNEWLIIRKDKVKTYKFHHTIYSGQELRWLMEQAGFAEVKLYGNLGGAPYDANAQRLIAIGWKA